MTSSRQYVLEESSDSEETALLLDEISAGYGGVPVLRNITLSLKRGGVTAVFGANGAGKTTLLRVASGLLRPATGRVCVGKRDITGLSAHERVHMGICLIPEGRGIFRSLTVRENLELQIPTWVSQRSIEPALAAFPILGERSNQVAGSLSGGQQQMLALSRAFLSESRVIMLDEVSMGLAPIAVDEIFAALERIAEKDVSVLLVEQYVTRALQMADDAYLLAKGSVQWSGPAGNVTPELLTSSYLGRAPL